MSCDRRRRYPSPKSDACRFFRHADRPCTATNRAAPSEPLASHPTWKVAYNAAVRGAIRISDRAQKPVPEQRKSSLTDLFGCAIAKLMKRFLGATRSFAYVCGLVAGAA